MVQKQQITLAPISRCAAASKNLLYSIGPLLLLCLVPALKLPVNCHSRQFLPIGMPPQLKQIQPPHSQQQIAPAARFAPVQPVITNSALHSNRPPGTNPNWPHQIGWSHVLRPSPWLHFARNLVAAPIASGASNWAPSARHLSLPAQQQQQPVASLQVSRGAVPPPTDRRVSPSQSSSTLVQPARPIAADASSRPAKSSTPAGHPQANSRSSRSSSAHWREPDRKVLICYYTTKQTAPYWPKEAREFVVPADQFEQAAADFFVANQNQPATVENQFQRPKTLANQANDEQANDSTRSATEAQQKQRRSIFANNAGGNGGRLVVIAPTLVLPSFNQSIGAKSNGANAAGMLAGHHHKQLPANELGIDRADSMAQMFHLAASNNRRLTIAERNDLLAGGNNNNNNSNNGATWPISSAPTNQSVGKQLAPPPGESNARTAAPNNGVQTGSNVVVFEHNLHDLSDKNRQLGGLATSQDKASAAQATHQSSKSRGTSSTGSRRQPLRLTPSSWDSTLLPASSISLNPTATPQMGGPIQNRNFASEHSPINSSEQLNQFYYYYNLPTTGQASGQGGWKNTGFSVSVAPTSGPTSQATASSIRYKSGSIPQSAASGGSTVQQGKSLQVPETNLDDTSKSTLASTSLLGSSVVPGTSVSPGGNPLWPSSGSTLAVSSSASTKPSPSLVFGRQPLERLPAGSRPNLVSIAGSSFSLDGQQYPSSAPGESPDASGLMRLASVASSVLHESSLAESLSLSKTTPAMSASVSSTSLSPGSSFFSGAVSERPAAPINSNQHSSGLNTNKLDEPTLASANNRNYQQPAESVKQTSIGLGGGNSLSAALVSSPLSTMFDVFGAASQYLMRLRPSSLISPASFAAFNSIGEYNHHAGGAKGQGLNSSLSSLVSSFGGSSGGHHMDQKTSASRNATPQTDHKSGGGFLSRLSHQLGQSHQQRREEICGRTIQTPERRIIGGEGAKYGEFPYQVHIKIAKHQCGGALIDRQSIVTAAHCVYHFITRAPVNKLQIVIGAYDIEDEQYQELPPQYFKVNKVKLHPNFRFSASHPDRYDVAILKLDKPVKYTDNVLPVCLPGRDLKYDNMVGTVTGFGKTDPSLSNRYGTRLLQKVDVPIIENSECERWHRTRGIDLKIFPEMMCAGYEDGLKDACVGDSGGPLVVKTPTGSNGSFRWTLAGITSAGFGCAQSRQPGIYHRVSHTVDWILDNLD